MYLTIDNTKYEVIIEKKKIKHTYLRVKDDLKIYVTTSKWTSNMEIEKIINKEIDSIKKMINRYQKRNEVKNILLGEPYDIVVVSNLSKPEFYHHKLYVRDNNQIEDYLKQISYNIFKERLDYFYNLFEENIPYPQLKVRRMKTRWGVCNRRSNSITINLELIKKEVKYIDYVIIHELCHFVHFNHSKLFWDLVKKYSNDYKSMRRELKDR
jgi:predicted metal-dependent hydrolase